MIMFNKMTMKVGGLEESCLQNPLGQRLGSRGPYFRPLQIVLFIADIHEGTIWE